MAAWSRSLRCGVCVKIRLFSDDRRAPGSGVARSVALCKALAAAGADIIVVHGRTRRQTRKHTGAADWTAIAAIVAAVDVPVVANGGIASASDVVRCFVATGVAAVMSAEALLENPALFAPLATLERALRALRWRRWRRWAPLRRRTTRFVVAPPPALAPLPRAARRPLGAQQRLALAYLDRVAADAPRKEPRKTVKSHVYRMLYAPLRALGLMEDFAAATSVAAVRALVVSAGDAIALRECGAEAGAGHAGEGRPQARWYERHRGGGAAPSNTELKALRTAWIEAGSGGRMPS